jgi:exodeoxyribonuclease VII large subunit
VSPQRVIEQRRQQLDECTERMQTSLQHMLALRGERLRGLTLQLHSLSPLLTIARGYGIVRRGADRTIVTSVQQVQPGEALMVQVQDGEIVAQVSSIHSVTEKSS